MSLQSPDWALGETSRIHGETPSFQDNLPEHSFAALWDPPRFAVVVSMIQWRASSVRKMAPRPASTDQFEPQRPISLSRTAIGVSIWASLAPALAICSFEVEKKKHTILKHFFICFILCYEIFFFFYKFQSQLSCLHFWGLNCNQCLCFSLISFELLSSRFSLVFSLFPISNQNNLFRANNYWILISTCFRYM